MTDARPVPLVLYIPGLLPKPPAEEHRDALLRCLLSSMRRADPSLADAFAAEPAHFDIISWTFDFYGEHRDIELDREDIETALQKTSPSETDIADAVHWKRRLMHSIYKAGDLLPFLIPKLANERLELHLRDLRRYATNDNGIAEHVRRLLKLRLEAAAAAGRSVLLIAHSMGSVIAWDALWEMSREERRDFRLDTWLTLGSPLGGNYIQSHLMGLDRDGDERYPDNVRRWVNIAAVGELTALDRTLRNDFQPMLQRGLVEDIVDHEIFSFYRAGGALNVHNEYGYLLHDAIGQQVAEWWAKKRSG